MTHGTANDLPAEIWELISRDLVYVYDRGRMVRPPPPLGTVGTPLDDIMDREPGQKPFKKGGQEKMIAGNFSSKYMGINRHFFNLYLDAKYKEVEWTKLDNDMEAQLRRLQSPIIGCRVRKLKVRVWFIEQLMRRERERGAQPPANGGIVASTLEAVQSGLSLISLRPGAPPKSKEPNVSSKSLLRLMEIAIHNMRDVTSCSFELRDLSLTKDTRRFLDMTRLSLAPSLRRLALHGTASQLKSFTTFTDLDNMEDLELYLDYQGHSGSNVTQDDIFSSKQREAEDLQDAIVPFLNSRKDSLRSLIFVSFSSANLSHLFRPLELFPRLCHVSIKACLDEAHLSDTNALVQFLHNHRSSLRQLDIRPCMPDIGDSGWVSNDHSLKLKDQSWARVQAALSQDRCAFLSLEGLHVPVGKLALCIQLTRRASPTLTHLSLADRPLHLEEVNSVLEVFSDRPFQLKSLLLEITSLRIEIIQLLANRLPGLKSLVLLCDELFMDTERAYELYAFSGYEYFVCNVTRLEQGQLDWGLQYITLLPRRNARISAEDAELIGYRASSGSTETGLAEVLARKVPSIVSFEAIRYHRNMTRLRIAPYNDLLSHFRFLLTLRSQEGHYRSLILFRLSSSSEIKTPYEAEGDDKVEVEPVAPTYSQLYIMESACPHLGADMSHAEIEDCDDGVVAVCPWHRYDFDLRTGKSDTGMRACTFAVEVKNEDGIDTVYMETPGEGTGWRIVERRPVSEAFADPPPPVASDFTAGGTREPSKDDEPITPLENPPITLMDWAVLILNTPNPRLKVERTRRAVDLFRTGKLKSIGHKSPKVSRPPDIPSRDDAYTRNTVDPTKVKNRRNRASMLHALANIEQWAIDLAWDIMVRFGPMHKDIPPAFFADFTKMALDESKHFSLLVSRLSALSPSTPYGSMPVHAGLWESATVTSDSFISRLAIIHLVHEARGLDVNPATIEKFRKAGDTETVKVMEIIHADEVTHVTAGHRWFTWAVAQEAAKGGSEGAILDPIQRFREEVRKGWTGDIKGPFNVEAREMAGLTPQFYEGLRGELGYVPEEKPKETAKEEVVGRVDEIVKGVGAVTLAYEK